MDPFLGEIKMVGFNFAPNGYSFCNGAILPIAQNSALFALLGTTFGGNGQTTFQLPDYRSRSPVGMGNGPGLTPIIQGEVSGSENVTLLITQMPAHTHAATISVAIPASTASGDVASPGPTAILATAMGVEAGLPSPVTTYVTSASNTTLAPFNTNGTIGTTGGNQPLPIRNPFLGTNFIIAMQGIFPSRP